MFVSLATLMPNKILYLYLYLYIYSGGSEIYSAATCIPYMCYFEYRYFTSKMPGPSCSKLTMSLVNDSLKF